jgi:hypothetical protein
MHEEKEKEKGIVVAQWHSLNQGKEVNSAETEPPL